jgi:dienelactone hydrolase
MNIHPSIRICTLASALSWLASGDAAAQATDPATPGPFTPSVVTATIPVTGGASLETDLYFPGDGAGGVAAAAGACPVVVFAHGFSRTPARYTDFGELLASRGFIVLLPDFPCGPFGCDHSKNADDLVAVIDWILARNGDSGSIFEGRVRTRDVGVSGHSAGGLWSLVAASRDPRIRAAAPMDPVDSNQLGVQALAAARSPIAISYSEPSSCNANGSAEDLYAAVVSQRRGVRLIGANHCDPEKDLDFLGCALICGAWNAERHQRYLRYVSGWFEYYLNCDPAYASWVWGDVVQADVAEGRVDYDGVPSPAAPVGVVAELYAGARIRRAPPSQCAGVTGWRVYRDEGVGQLLVADGLGPQVTEWIDTTVQPGRSYTYVVRDWFGDFLGEAESADSAPAVVSVPTVSPLEAAATGSVALTLVPAPGDALQLSFAPAPCATDHTAYWGIAADRLDGGPRWTGQSCFLGAEGAAVVEVPVPDAGSLLYLVVVGNDGSVEGSYGESSDGQRRLPIETPTGCAYGWWPAATCDER